MNLYPLHITVSRNLKQSLAVVPTAQVFVYEDKPDGLPKPLYPDRTAAPGTEIKQPVPVDPNAQALVYTTPGRVRVDQKIDEFLTVSFHLTLADDDNISLPIWGELPSGTPDGVLQTFVLAKVPIGGKVSLYVDGLRWRQVDLNVNPFGNQFNVEGAILTLGTPPLTGAVVLADYTPVKV